MTFDEETRKEMLLDMFGVYLMQKMEDMQNEKAERLKGVEPRMITKQELFDAIETDKRTILNRWFKEGKIRVHKTIHAPIHDYVELIKE